MDVFLICFGLAVTLEWLIDAWDWGVRLTLPQLRQQRRQPSRLRGV